MIIAGPDNANPVFADILLFLKRNVLQILAWPLFCLLVASALWWSVTSKLQTARSVVETNALIDAGAHAKSYAAQLDRMVYEIDQITLLVKYEWERSGQGFELTHLQDRGILPRWQYAQIAVVNRDGTPVTDTVPDTVLAPLGDSEFFRFHKKNNSTQLLIGNPAFPGSRSPSEIQLSRRLNAPDGTFDGMVLVTVPSSYFVSLFNSVALGKYGLIAVFGDTGLPLVLSNGGEGNASLPAVWPRQLPAISTDAGSAMRVADWFGDRHPRYVSWEPLTRYPLVAVVGLSVDEKLMPHQDAWSDYRNFAIASSIALLLFAAVATLLSVRLAWRKHREEEVKDAYRIASEGGNDGFYMMRALRNKSGDVTDFEVVDCNVRGASFYGAERDQFIGMRSSAINQPSHFQTVLDTYCNAMRIGYYEDELKVTPDSPLKVEWVHRRLVRSRNGLAVTLRDISQAKAHERELWRMANYDALTCLPNRNWLANTLPYTLTQASNDQRMLAVLFVDLDDFKNINDALGHSIGDELLRLAAQRLRALVAPGDHVVRLGGDEFTIILEHITGEEQVAEVANRIGAAFAQPFNLSRGANSIGTSIGISLFPRDGDDMETLLKNSDIAMYHAKSEGKGSYYFYMPSLSARLKLRLDTEHALQQAIERDQFTLFYQPRVDAFSGELCGMEALVRWMHPERGLVPPAEFIPLAEKTGLILKLGELVVEQACEQIAQWKAMRLPLVPVSINVSPYQFQHGNIRELFTNCLRRHDLDPALVEIELTESSMIGEQDEIATELAAIRALGIKLLVDDFGTGYSSLSLLQRLDMDILKVDRAFTSALGKSAEGEVFFRAIVSMAHALGMSVVAEGVETAEQLRLLQSLSCDEIQGYFISRPVPAAEARSLLNRSSLLPLPAALLTPTL